MFFFIIVLLSSFSFTYQQVCDHQDESSLLAFGQNLSTPSSRPLNWSSSSSCCQWEGVECDTNGRVIGLQLHSRDLKGKITSSIGDLVSLTLLILSNNTLYGSLGEGIVRLTNLRTLDLSQNRFSGPIPQEIGNLLYLESLSLQNNSLSGPIPPSLMKCTNLLNISLRDNHLDGNISELDFSRLVKLQKLDLLNNRFSGSIPESIYSCKSLIAVRLAENYLIGQISPKILQLKSLSYLALSQNSLTNVTNALTILSNCNNLTYLSFENNFFGESLPSDKNFIGLNKFPKLEILSLQGCSLSGLFPEWLANVKTLRALDLNQNRFSGKIPPSIGSLPNLYYLTIDGNLLFGEIPKEVCQLPILVSENVDPKHNHLDLPLDFFSHSASGRKQYSTLPLALSFSSNKLSGHIPLEIGKLRNLQRLILANNSLSGPIPKILSNLKRLEALDLSRNNLTGGIPTSLTSLSFLGHLNLSYNNLEGPIPDGVQFDTFGSKSFTGNPKLCGKAINISCLDTTSPRSNGDQPLNGGKRWFLHGLYVGFASGFSGILVIVVSYVWYKA